MKDKKDKDITMNWRMYNGFNANKTFWTDANSLNMVKREIIQYPRPEHTASGNFFPVTSAIAMRDH